MNISDTKTYQRQHGEIVKLVQDVQTLLLPDSLLAEAYAVRLKLSELVAKVEVHLAMEDGRLYPALMAHSDPEVRDTASRFNNEMSGIRAVFETYRTKWTESAIHADSAGFIEETNRLFVALANRINRENSELYALLERETPVNRTVRSDPRRF